MFSVITADLLGYTGAGLGLGYWLCKKLDWTLWVVPALGMVGLAFAFYRIYEFSKKDWNR